MLKISVVIPFFGPKEKLEKLLLALKKQTLAQEDFEVLVIDNNEKQILESNSFYQVFHQPIPGSYAARNLGIEKAKGNVLFFTDSDCMPDPTWLEHGLKAIKEKGGIIAGHIKLLFKNPHSPSALELYERIFYFQQGKYIEKESYGATANLIVEKSIFDKGRFDSALRSGGDQEFCQRMVKAKIPLHYCDDVLVFHPSRSQWKDFLVRRVRALSGNIFLNYRSVGYTWKQLSEKIGYYLDSEKMRDWNGDWDFYESLSLSDQKRVKNCHRILTIIDIFILISSKLSYRFLKYFTMIDRKVK